MKIVFLSHDSNCIGGAQLCLMNLIKGIKSLQPTTEIYLILNKEGTMLEACQPYITGYKVIKQRRWWLYKKKKSDLPFVKFLKISMALNKGKREIANYLREIQPDYAVTNTIVVPQLAMVCKMCSVKHIWFIHEIPMLSWNDYRFIYSTEKCFQKIDSLSSKIIVPSDFTNQFISQYIPSGKIHTIAQAVEVEIGALKDRNNKRYTVLMVGAIEQNKGQMELIEAVKIFVSKGNDILCRFVGGSDAHYMEQCKAYITDNHLANYIEFVPFTSSIMSHYNNADVVINCSGMETFGRVAVEAQLCGLPVILSNVGGNLERIEDGVNGYFYEKGNVDSLVQKIELLQDQNRREMFRDNLKLLNLDQYSLCAFASNFTNILELEKGKKD